MGMMRFRVAPTGRITEEMVQFAYLSGMDRGLWPVHASAAEGEIVLQRAASDSANLHIPWPVEGFGLLTLSSACLMERAEPYWLPLELARGAIVQVRNQLSDWQTFGLTVPQKVSTQLAEAAKRFSWAAVAHEDAGQSAEHAEAALQTALSAGDLLTAAYAEQALAVRRRGGGRCPFCLGADLGSALLDSSVGGRLIQTFNAVKTPIVWRDIETAEGDFDWAATDRQIAWCRANGLKTLAGPLLVFDPAALPDSFYLFEDDVESVRDFASTFVRAAVGRYRGQVDAWICAGRVNASDELALGEQDRLQLVAQTMDLVRSLDPDTPVMVSFDQPWAEYMRRRESDFPPLHFADALIRAGMNPSGILLEINVGYWPGGSFPRHPLEFSRLLDAWSMLGLPLWVGLSASSGGGPDPLARNNVSTPADAWTPTLQQAWAARCVPLALAKPLVHGVLWNQLCDNLPHEFPHGGLFDRRGRPKPALRTLAAIRKKYLA